MNSGAQPSDFTLQQVGSPHVRFSASIDNPTDTAWRASLRSKVAGVGRLLHLTVIDGDLAGQSAFGVVAEDGVHIVGRSPFALA